jgi:hypothetical protein
MEKMIEYYGAENLKRMKSTGIAEIKTAELAGKESSLIFLLKILAKAQLL